MHGITAIASERSAPPAAAPRAALACCWQAGEALGAESELGGAPRRSRVPMVFTLYYKYGDDEQSEEMSMVEVTQLIQDDSITDETR
jgi:hypothetical protein